MVERTYQKDERTWTMRILCVLLVAVSLLLCASAGFAGMSQIGPPRIQTLPGPGHHAPGLYGHISYYPGSAWGVYTVNKTTNVRSNDTKMADYNIAADFAVPLKKGALGFGGYTMSGSSISERELHFAYYSPRSWGLQYGQRRQTTTNDAGITYVSTAPVVEAIFFPASKLGRPQFTVGLGGYKPFGDWKPSMSLNASIPMKDKMSFDISLWTTRESVQGVTGASSDQWTYRASAGIGYSF